MRHAITLSLIAASFALPVFATTNAATVNGVALSQARLDAMVQQMEQPGQEATAELLAAARERLIMGEILRQEAIKKGLEKSADYKAQLENVSSALLANLLVSDFMKAHPPSEAQAQAKYNELKAASNQKEYHARHILVANQAEADKLLAQLKKGAKFEDLARKHSIDSGSKASGGDLGWADPKSFVPEFSAELIKLEPGQTSAPVQTQFGWHIIQLVEVKEIPFPPYDQVKQQIEQKLQNDELEKYLAEIKEKATVK